jgi:ubiquinol-cytochrome c reductase cytochrome c subunit
VPSSGRSRGRSLPATAVLVLAAAAVLAWPAAAWAEDGRTLYEESCSSCHGLEGRGVPQAGPSLLESGPAALDFELSTGRMPMTEEPGEQPMRKEPVLGEDEIRAITAYVVSLGAEGAGIPDVDAARGDVAAGLKTYTTFCAGCHQIAGAGGVVVQAVAPPLDEATAEQVAEAVRVGPYVMPAFGEATIDDRALDDLAAYVRYARQPEDPGGWSLGHVGPIPEGMVAWLVGAAALVGIARLLGERAP